MSAETGIYPKQFECLMLGAHDGTMFGVLEATKLDGAAGSRLIERGDFTQQMFEAAVIKARQAAFTIFKLTNSSTYYAPGRAVVKMVSAYLDDARTIIPCSVYLEGQYNTNGICIGVPAMIGKNGVEQVIELDLGPKELAAFAASVVDVQAMIDALKTLSLHSANLA